MAAPGLMLQAVCACAATTADYPNRPIRVVTGGVGGGSDFAARLIAQGLTGRLGQLMVIDNRGSGMIPCEIVAQAPADGHTLLLFANALWIAPLMHKTQFDPMKDFAPITLAVTAPNILVVHPTLQARSVKELIALAKARPGALNYSSSAAGASNHLAAELFKTMAGVNITRIPYNNGATQMADLVAGQVQLTFATGGTVMPHAKSGKLIALAFTSAKPSQIFPHLPTIAAAGLPGYESAGYFAVFAPTRTPSVILERLNREIVHTLKEPDVREKFFNMGIEPVGSTPSEITAIMSAEITRLGKVIRDAGIRAD